MDKSHQTNQDQIGRHPTEATPHHAKPFLKATTGQKASKACIPLCSLAAHPWQRDLHIACSGLAHHDPKRMVHA